MKKLVLFHIMEVKLQAAKVQDEALQLSKNTFVKSSACCVNDEVWLELSFKLIKLVKSSRNEDPAHEKKIERAVCADLGAFRYMEQLRLLLRCNG